MSGLFTERQSESEFFKNDNLSDVPSIIESSDIVSREQEAAATKVKKKENDKSVPVAHTPTKVSSGNSLLYVVAGIILAAVAVIALMYYTAAKNANMATQNINEATQKLHSVAIRNGDSLAETARTSPDVQTRDAATRSYQIVTSMKSQKQDVISRSSSADETARVLALPVSLCTMTDNIKNVANQGTADVINECNSYNSTVESSGKMAKSASRLPLMTAPDILK